MIRIRQIVQISAKFPLKTDIINIGVSATLATMKESCSLLYVKLTIGILIVTELRIFNRNQGHRH